MAYRLGVVCILLTAFAAPDVNAQMREAKQTEGPGPLRETRLAPGRSATETPPGWTGDIVASEVSPESWPFERVGTEPGWVGDRRAFSRQFVDPLLISPVHSAFFARLAQAGGWNTHDSTGELDQLLHLSAGWFELYAPVFTVRDNVPYHPGRFRLNAKLPVRIGDRHVVAPELGAHLPTSGALASDGGFATRVGYAYGAHRVSAQVRAGFGYDQIIGDFEAPLRSSIFYDAAAGLLVAESIQALVQLDGQRYVGNRGNVVRLWPGVRLYPLADRAFSLAVGAQVWWEQDPEEWFLRRAGAFVDFGWTFL